jgi:chromosome segregation ATPase
MKSLATCSILIALALQACAAQDRRAEQPPPPARANEATAQAPERPAEAPRRPEQPATPAPPQAPPSNTWYAMRVVRVSTSGDEEAARSAIQEATSSQFLANLLKQRDLDPALQKAIAITARQVEGREAVDVAIIVDLSQDAREASPIARETADAIVAALRQQLVRNARGTLDEQLRLVLEERTRAEAELQKSRQQLDQIREKVRAATGRAEASAERIRDDLARLEDARQEIQLDLETSGARVAALSENIAKMTKQIEQRVQNDEVAAELQKIVQAREQKAERLKKMAETGIGTQEEYQDALAEAAEARARLLERRQQVADHAGGDTVNAWNREMMKLSVDSAELQARLKALEQRVQSFHTIVNELDDLEALAESRKYAEHTLHETREQLRALERKLTSIRPPRSIVTQAQDRSGPVPAAAGEQDSGNVPETRGE